MESAQLEKIEIEGFRLTNCCTKTFLNWIALSIFLSGHFKLSSRLPGDDASLELSQRRLTSAATGFEKSSGGKAAGGVKVPFTPAALPSHKCAWLIEHFVRRSQTAATNDAKERGAAGIYDPRIEPDASREQRSRQVHFTESQIQTAPRCIPTNWLRCGRVIQRSLVLRCARGRCFGGPRSAGRFQLFPRTTSGT
jgi:hypothetical protein